MERSKARAKELSFGMIADPRLHVRKAIPVVISRKAGSVIAQARIFEEFGCGPTSSSALEDLSKGLAELYWCLKTDRERLGPDLARLHSTLTEYIEERPRSR
jgi:hypothetical protein